MGANFIMLAAAAAEEEEQQAIEIMGKELRKEKMLVIDSRAAHWKEDKDIIATYGALLRNNLFVPTSSVEKIINDNELLYENLSTASIDSSSYTVHIKNFVDFLLAKKGKKEAVRILNECELFKKTLECAPNRINEFMGATNCYDSKVGQYEIDNDAEYILENDIYQNRKKLFLNVLSKQKQPICHYTDKIDFTKSDQEDLIKSLERTRASILKKALYQDPVVPAIIIASGDQKFLKSYLMFLMDSGFKYHPEESQIVALLDQAKAEAQKPEYKNLFIEACPAFQKKKLVFGLTRTVFDDKTAYECPIVAHHMNKFRSASQKTIEQRQI